MSHLRRGRQLRALRCQGGGLHVLRGRHVPEHKIAISAGFEQREFMTLADYAKATGQDRHSALVAYDIFMNAPRLDAQDRVKLRARPGPR